MSATASDTQQPSRPLDESIQQSLAGLGGLRNDHPDYLGRPAAASARPHAGREDILAEIRDLDENLDIIEAAIAEAQNDLRADIAQRAKFIARERGVANRFSLFKTSHG